MKREFVTSTGSIVWEGDILYFRRTIYSLYYKYLLMLALATSFTVRLIVALYEEKEAKRNFEIVLYGLGVLIWGLPLVYELLRKTYARRIPLQAVASYQAKALANGLETELILKLRSGRIKTVRFRNLEKQLEDFTGQLNSAGIPGRS